MNDFRDRSKTQLKEKTNKFIKDLYVSCLDRAEKILKPSLSSPKWRQFRFEIMNIGNDKIRQLNDVLEEYRVEYRPPIFSVEYKIDVGESKVADFHFSFVEDEDPCFTMRSTNLEALKQVQHTLSCGFISDPEGTDLYTFHIMGLYDIFHKAIPCFDNNNAFKGKTLERYNAWKEKVYKLESGNVR